jgi:hypothetical protein
MIGRRFGKLVVEKQAASDGGRQWWCICDCGNRCVARGISMRNGHKQSCGCVRAAIIEDKDKRDMAMKRGFLDWKRRTKDGVK